MKRFTYKAKDRTTGRLLVGEVEANNLTQAAGLVKKKGWILISIKPAGFNLSSFVLNLRSRVKLEDVASFTRQLSTMVNAGLPITESLVILRNQSTGEMQRVVAQILADVEGGDSLSSSLAKHPKVFSQTYIALVRSGEVGGVLDQVMSRLADNLEKQMEFKGKVEGALIYPAIIIIGMFIVGLIMMIFVIPRLTSLYAEFNAELPLPTKILIAVSNFLVSFWPLVILGIGALIWGFMIYRRTPFGRRKVDELIFKIPIVGPLQRQVILTELTQTLSLMTGAGVSILESLNITADAVGNVVISDALKEAALEVEKGFPVSFSFAKHPEAFPYILSQMIAVGEETGKMDEVLSKVSHVFQIESEQKVKTLTTAIEPLVMILLGIGVGFLVVAIILPIYNLTSKF